MLFPPLGDLPNPGMEPKSLPLQVESLPTELSVRKALSEEQLIKILLLDSGVQQSDLAYIYIYIYIYTKYMLYCIYKLYLLNMHI